MIETAHLRGQSFKDKVLVFPAPRARPARHYFHLARLSGAAPTGAAVSRTNTKVALGAVVTHAPAVTDFDRDPFDARRHGDWVKVDGDRGLVEITKKAAR